MPFFLFFSFRGGPDGGPDGAYRRDEGEYTAVPAPKPAPVRKPDPSVRELRRQISFGSGTGGFPAIGQSIKKKTPGIGTSGQSASVDSGKVAATEGGVSGSKGSLGDRTTSLISPPPAILEDGESACHDRYFFIYNSFCLQQDALWKAIFQLQLYNATTTLF